MRILSKVWSFVARRAAAIRENLRTKGPQAYHASCTLICMSSTATRYAGAVFLSDYSELMQKAQLWLDMGRESG